MTNQSKYTKNINESKKNFPKTSVNHYLSHEILEVLTQSGTVMLSVLNETEFECFRL